MSQPNTPTNLRNIHNAASRLFAAGREVKNYGQTAERICRDLACTYGSPESKTQAEAELATAVARLIANAEDVADMLPALREAAGHPTQAEDVEDRARDLTRLGMTVRVRYVGPTNTKGGRYVAEVCGDDDAARVYVSSQLHNRDEATRLAAAEKCLAKWHAARVTWWKTNVGKAWELPLPVIKSVGSTGDAWLFFTK